MRIVVSSLMLLSMAIGSLGCKTTARNGSAVESEKDIQDGSIRWIESEGKFAIRCRDGRLHNGFKSVLIRAEDLKNACEQKDPNWNPGGGGGSVGGGPGPGPIIGNEVSLAQCEQMVPPRPIDPRVAQLSVAIAPDLASEILAIQPAALRGARLCNGVGGQLAQLVANDETFNLFKGTNNGNQPITLIVGVAGSPVKFNKFDPSLTIPWQIDNDTVAKINQEIAVTGGNVLCGTSAKYMFEKCWVLGAAGKSCDQVCQDKGKQYTAFTSSIIGTQGGTVANEKCAAVCKEFGYAIFQQSTPSGQFDCFVQSGNCIRDNDPDGDSRSSANAGIMRICQCQ